MKVIRNPGLGLALGMDKHYVTPNPTRNGQPAHIAAAQVHGVGEVAELDVYVKRLGEEVDGMPVVPLELEIVAHILAETLEVAVIPHHADLVYQYDGTLGEGHAPDLVYVEKVGTGDIHGGIHRPATPYVAHGGLDKEGGLAGTLLPKNHNELIRITVTEGKDGNDNDKGQRENKEKRNETTHISAHLNRLIKTIKTMKHIANQRTETMGEDMK